jgi:Ca-activated chloride channel family protein
MAPADSGDYYAILGVLPTAAAAEMSIALNHQVKRFPEEERDPTTNRAFRELVIAYRVLSHPERRAAYDKTRVTSTVGASEALMIQLLVSQAELPAMAEDQVLYLLLRVSANPAMVGQKPAVNLSLVIDRSTSMDGARIHEVKAAASAIVDQLEPRDSLSLITFSDRAKTIIPAMRVDNKPLIRSRISQISTGGATEILQGLQKALTELHKARRGSQINHLILLTDGHTYGDAEECIEAAKKAAEEGIGFSALGIGHEWNDLFLDALVTPSGGSSAYLEGPERIDSYLAKRIESLSQTFAQDLHLRLGLSPRISVRSADMLSPSPHPIARSRLSMALGTLQHSAPLSMLAELVVQPHSPGETSRVKADISANIISTGQRAQHFVSELQLSFESDSPVRPPLRAVERAVNKVNLYRMSEKAREEAEQGQLQEATRRMKRVATHLLNAGHGQLAQAALDEAVHIARTGSVSVTGHKRLKYGTRALIADDNLS